MKPVRLASLCVAAASVLLPAHAVFAQDKTQDQAQSRQTIRDQDIYGSEMMTSEERNEYRQKMRAAGSAEERERLRAEHHEQMKERAQARGMTLPDQPRAGDLRVRPRVQAAHAPTADHGHGKRFFGGCRQGARTGLGRRPGRAHRSAG